MADRRRINGPPSGTAPPVYASTCSPSDQQSQRPRRTRAPNQLRKIYLRTGLTPSASGSAYLELSPTPTSSPSPPRTLTTTPSALKLTATVHGPHPLPRSAPFTPHLLLTCTLKFAPFASRAHRRGFVRDAAERDLAVHLETALRGVVVGERWPKSGVDVCVTVLEGEDDVGVLGGGGGSGGGGGGYYGSMAVLAGAITAASAALVDAGIDCVDLVAGGVAAVVPVEESNTASTQSKQQARDQQTQIVLDPCPAEHETILSACVVGYLANRDEITEVWVKGATGAGADTHEELIDRAVEAASASRTVLAAALVEATEASLGVANEVGTKGGGMNGTGKAQGQDVEMAV